MLDLLQYRMKKANLQAVLAIVGLLLTGCCACRSAPHSSPSSFYENIEMEATVSALEARYDRLRLGVNLYGWFAGNDGLVADHTHRLNFIKKTDAVRIRHAGFTNVRLCVTPAFLFNENSPSQFKDRNFLSSLNSSIKMLLDAGLSVTLVVFPNDAFKERLFRDKEFVAKFAMFWGALAANFTDLNPDLLFFEIINEPNFIRFAPELRRADSAEAEKSAAEKWNAVQEELLKAIRGAARKHTVVLTGDNLSKIRTLVETDPYGDPNVIYSVHIYDPYAFSHQGAPWDARVSGVKGLSYPTDLRNCEVIKQQIPEKSRELVETYCLIGWNKKLLERQVKLAVAWAEKHNVKIWIGEFGAYPNHAPQGRASQYLRDMRTIFEKYGLGWCVWEYEGWLDRLRNVELTDALGLARPDSLP